MIKIKKDNIIPVRSQIAVLPAICHPEDCGGSIESIE
jgi:hypothetical protein